MSLNGRTSLSNTDGASIPPHSWYPEILKRLYQKPLTFEEISHLSNTHITPAQVGQFSRYYRNLGVAIIRRGRLLLVEGESRLSVVHPASGAIPLRVGDQQSPGDLQSIPDVSGHFLSEGTLGTAFQSALQDEYNRFPVGRSIGISQVVYCPRKLYLTHTTFRRPSIDHAGLGKMFRGRALHEALRKILLNNRRNLKRVELLAQEKPVAIDVGPFQLLGRYDIKVLVNGIPVIYDWKFTDWPRREDSPHQHYADQVMLYAYGDGVSHGGLCYIDVKDFSVREYVFPINKERISFLLERFRMLMEAINRRVPPERPFKSPLKEDGWECGYCSARALCWPNNAEEVSEQLVPNPIKPDGNS